MRMNMRMNMRIPRPSKEVERLASRVPHLVDIQHGTFYREHPSSNKVDSPSSNPPLYPKLKIKIEATPEDKIGWPVRTSHVAVIGANTTPFLSILQGQYICVPPKARSYPYLASEHIPENRSHLRLPSRAIKYVGFNSKTSSDAAGGVRGAYLSARYESRREETDWLLRQYLHGQTELNPSLRVSGSTIDEESFSRIVHDLRLENLLDLPVSHLSNGQTRRARIAKALVDEPRLLLLDDPFMGLDPPTLVSLGPILREMAVRSSPRIVLGLRPQDPIPEWITHLYYLSPSNEVVVAGSTMQTLFTLYTWRRASLRNGTITAFEKGVMGEMPRNFGPPPSNIPPILTSYGLRDIDFFDEVWDIMHKQRDPETGKLSGSAFPPWEQKIYDDWLESSDRRPGTSLIPMSLLSKRAWRTVLGGEKRLKKSPPASDQKHAVIDSSPASSPASDSQERAEPLIELSSIVVKYGDKVVLGHEPPQPGFDSPGLNLTVSRGSRLLLLGSNGSGKTTLLSLLTSDHPQSYSLPIKFFGRTRLPSPGKPGLSLWQIQSRIGHSSPEVHAFFPKGLTVRQILESAWAETFSARPNLTPERIAMVDHFLHVWKQELCHDMNITSSSSDLSWASDKVRHPTFGQLPFGTQRLLLLLRAIIKQPDIIVLDEACSGLTEVTRKKALDWLEKGDNAEAIASASSKPKLMFPGLTEQQAIIVVSHVRQEIPSCINEYIRLPSEEEARENKRTVQIVKTRQGYMSTLSGWNAAWGL